MRTAKSRFLVTVNYTGQDGGKRFNGIRKKKGEVKRNVESSYQEKLEWHIFAKKLLEVDEKKKHRSQAENT